MKTLESSVRADALIRLSQRYGVDLGVAPKPKVRKKFARPSTRRPVADLDATCIYASVGEAARRLGVKPSAITHSLRNNWRVRGHRLAYYVPANGGTK